MHIVFNISDEEVENLKNSNLGMKWYQYLIGHGTVLPRGHGRLIDADDYVKKNEVFGWLDGISVNGFESITHTIIEADTSESEVSKMNNLDKAKENNKGKL